MRLHSLTVTAFGPFRDTQYIDFDDLSSGGLFLLHGATGAGKTSLLDAVCFALYAAVPGARQQPGGTLRSHHADPHSLTRVVLDLTVGDRRLEITRAPEQPRPKKSGTGFTRERAQSALREYDATAGEWKPLSRSHQEIGEEITQLLGMSRDQFCQVVLLPQGDFARFLRATAEERGKLLGRLFDTGTYAAAEEQLARMRKEAQEQVGEGDDTLTAYAHRLRQAAGPGILADLTPRTTPGSGPAQAGRERRPAPVPDQRAPGGAPAPADGPGADRPATAEALLEWAAMARSAARERHETAAVTVRAAEERHDRALRTLSDTRELLRRRQQYTDAQIRLTALQARNEERRTTADRLERARAADTVAPLTGLRAGAAAEHARTGSAEARARAALPEHFSDAPPGTLARHERETRQKLGAFDAARRAEQRRDGVRGELAALDRESRADEGGLREAAHWLADWDDARRTLQRRVDDAHDAATRSERLAGRLEPALRRLQAAHDRDRLTDEKDAAGRDLMRTREKAVHAKEYWLDVRDRRLQGIAAELAAELRDGQACGVCGATAHPAPAAPAADHADHRAEDAALADHQRAEAEREAADQRLRSARDQLTTARAEAGEDTTEALAEAVRQLEAELAGSRRLAADAHPAREALDGAEREHARRLTARQEAERRSAARTSRREALQREDAAITEELSRFHAGRGGPGGPTRPGAPDEARGARTIGERAEALERHAAQLAVAADAARTADAAARHLQDNDDRLDDALRSAGFASAEAAGAALLDTAAQRRIRETLDAWEVEERAVTAVLADPVLADAAKRPPADTEGAERRVGAAGRALRAATTAVDAARTRCEDLDALSARATEEVRRTAPLRRAHERVAALAALAAGTSAENQRRMRLETYVLAARLEQVAAAASARLAHMSAGRYTLVHSDERSSGRTRSGLGLHVVDSWTGVQRDTATLSGGETFFASLALALGLADVVTDEAGGTRLDTLFIDEGFGSLDEQTLDEVLDVLDALRERDRCVGIVSHVADLRTRIPVQLEVLKTRTGSSLRRRAAPLGR